MDAPPSVESVCAAIATLYHNPEQSEKDKASTWLQHLQKSVYAWKVADDLLHQKVDVECCYIAAQTMRTKIQSSFHELPKESHHSLKESLLEHVSSIDERTSTVIVTQLCLALADLVLIMPDWPNAVRELIQRFALSRPWALLEVLVVLPEEVNSRHLRLGANRREEAVAELRAAVPEVLDFLSVCLNHKASKVSYKASVFKCYTSWLHLGVIPLDEIDQNEVMIAAFRTMASVEESSSLHEPATDCVCTLLVRLEEAGGGAGDIEPLEVGVFTAVSKLDSAYHLAVAHEDIEKAHNFCRLFTETGETFLFKILNSSSPGTHFAISIFNYVLNCCSHPDYEVADITFNLWYRLSEELYQRNADYVNATFRPYVERLINALCKQCQIEPDTEGILEEGEDFTEFRGRVVELIKDVVFIVGSSNVFKHMLTQMGGTTPTWESTEAALFIMHAVARNLIPTESEVVPQVVESLLCIPGSAHIAVRHTSIRLMGELCEWIDQHPENLERILNWLLQGLQHPLVASEAAHALQNICSQCQRHMWPHFDGLVHIVGSVDNFKLKPAAANGLIKGVADILSSMPHDKIQAATRTLCGLQAEPLKALIERHRTSTASPIYKNTVSDPVLYLDRLASIFGNVTPSVTPGVVHPCQEVATDLWPILSAACDTFAKEERIMERCCRTLRFTVRCLGTQSAPLLQPMVEKIVSLYRVHPHSCFLYLGSILVDEYAELPGCVPGLLEMMQAFLEPTFNLLKDMEGMRARPDTVDDFFRLNARFLQRSTIAFLAAPFLPSVIACGLQGTALDHRDANASVMKFFFDLLHCGRSKEERDDFKIRSTAVTLLKEEYGAKLIDCLIRAIVFNLPSYTFQDIGDVIFELMLLDRVSVCHWLESSLKSLPGVEGNPTTIPTVGPCVTRQQLVKFHKSVTSAEQPRPVTDAIRDFSRLWR